MLSYALQCFSTSRLHRKVSQRIYRSRALVLSPKSRVHSIKSFNLEKTFRKLRPTLQTKDEHSHISCCFRFQSEAKRRVMQHYVPALDVIYMRGMELHQFQWERLFAEAGDVKITEVKAIEEILFSYTKS